MDEFRQFHPTTPPSVKDDWNGEGIFIWQETVGGGTVEFSLSSLQSLSETAGWPLTKHTSSPLLLSGAKLFISLMSLVTTNCPVSLWSFVPIDADRANLCDIKYTEDRWGKRGGGTKKKWKLVQTKTDGAGSIKPEGAVWLELRDKDDCGGLQMALHAVLIIGKPLPPVHLLHQVCAYQKACPVEAVRAVNTFKEKATARHSKANNVQSYRKTGFLSNLYQSK